LRASIPLAAAFGNEKAIRHQGLCKVVFTAK